MGLIEGGFIRMGRERYRSGRSSTKRGGVGGGEKEGPSNGCMSAFLQLFDFHPMQFPLHQHSPSFKSDSVLPEGPTSLKGVEAPRNSLESIGAAPLFYIDEKEDVGSLKIPMGIQIKTSRDTRPKVVGDSKAKSATDFDLCSENIYSPGTKTPTLVARLMGLDLLPESSSPSLSSISGDPIPLRKSQLQHLRAQNLKGQIRPKNPKSFLHNDNVSGTRSLPETPRMSSARRSDVDRRLSLQINKENISFSEELRRELMKHEDERSPSGYARQIVKQVKESVSRRVGIDITNTIRNRENRGDAVLPLPIFQSKKSPKSFANFVVVDKNSPGKTLNAPSCSPKLRFMEHRSKGKTVKSSAAKDQTPQLQFLKKSSSSSSFLATYDEIQSQPVKISSKPKPQQPEKQQRVKENRTQKCQKAVSDRFRSRLKKPPHALEAQIRNKQEEPFKVRQSNNSDRSCKRTPLSNELIINPKTLVPVKKDPSAPPPKTPPQQLPNFSSQLYVQEATHKPVDQEGQEDYKLKGAPITTTSTDGEAEDHYASNILGCTGIDRETPISIHSWFSISHPLDPSIFHYLEQNSTNITTTTVTITESLTLQCKRKLIFDLIDEILGCILKPANNLMPWAITAQVYGHNMCGHQLAETLCTKIRSFPLADCKVLGDIDALIAWDLSYSKFIQSWKAYDEDDIREGIILEIEKDILDSLVLETAAAVFGGPLF